MTFLGSILLLAQRIGYIGIGLFGIGFLIGFHELGHFLFCKLFKIGTPSFSIGFGPKIFSRKMWGTEFIISPIPLGGFVEIAGAGEVGQGEQKEAQSTAPDSFAIKPYYQKLLVLLGGILFNLGFAYIALIGLSMLGLPKTPLLYPVNGTTIVKHIEPDSPAASIGLQENDIITEIDGIPVRDNTIKLIETVQDIPGKKTSMLIERENNTLTFPITIAEKKIDNKTIGTLGIECATHDISSHSIIGSISQGIYLTNQLILKTFQAFGTLFKGGGTKNLGGPIAVVGIAMKGASAGFKILVLLLAIISINLAILNLIPLPIFDGGQILFYTIEAIMGRTLPTKVREYIHIGTWLLVLGLVIFLSVRDISRMASPYVESVKQFLGFSR